MRYQYVIRTTLSGTEVLQTQHAQSYPACSGNPAAFPTKYIGRLHAQASLSRRHDVVVRCQHRPQRSEQVLSQLLARRSSFHFGFHTTQLPHLDSCRRVYGGILVGSAAAAGRTQKHLCCVEGSRITQRPGGLAAQTGITSPLKLKR